MAVDANKPCQPSWELVERFRRPNQLKNRSLNPKQKKPVDPNRNALSEVGSSVWKLNSSPAWRMAGIATKLFTSNMKRTQADLKPRHWVYRLKGEWLTLVFIHCAENVAITAESNETKTTANWGLFILSNPEVVGQDFSSSRSCK